MLYDLTIVNDALIGDYVIWHDTVSAYKDKYAEKKVLLVCDERLMDVAKQDNFYSDIIGFNRKKMKDIRYVASLIWKLRNIRTNLLIYPSTTRHIDGEIPTSSIMAKTRIGFKGYAGDNDLLKSLMRKFFSLRYTNLVDVTCENEIEALESFTRKVLASDFSYGHHPLKVRKIDFGIKDKYALIALSSSIDSKIWRVDNFAKIINKIPNQYKIVLSGFGADDVERANTIKSLVFDNNRIIDMIGKTSVYELLSLIAQSTFVIGNDSAAVHIAAATRVPSICVFHGAHFGRFLPYPENKVDQFYNPRAVFYKMDCYGCCYRCDKPKSNGSLWCLDKVTVEMVNSELNKLLEEIENRNESTE